MSVECLLMCISGSDVMVRACPTMAVCVKMLRTKNRKVKSKRRVRASLSSTLVALERATRVEGLKMMSR